MDSRQVVADACATLNLLATRQEVALLLALNWSLLEPLQAQGQARYLSSPPNEDGHREREAVSLQALQEARLLETVELTSAAEVDAFVEAAARIDDADAACIALAGVRNLPLFTDNKKERRIAHELFPAIELISTLGFLHDAALALGWGDRELRAAAFSLRWRGNFAAPRGDPRAQWYSELLNPVR
jgi:hypothetical protein